MSVKSSKTAKIAPISTLLVPTDFSKGAEWALDRALRLPLARGAAVHLVFVLVEPTFDAPLRKAQAAAAAALKETVSRAKALAKDLGLKISISGKVLAGRPFEEIVHQSRLLGAELIVLGRHGRRPIRDMFIGSTADRVVRYGDLPVLVVAGPARQPYGRPLAAVDFGETTRETLGTLLRVVGPGVTEVALARSYLVPFEGLVAASFPLAGETIYRSKVRERAASEAAEVLAGLPRWGVTWRTLIIYGEPRGAALRAARTNKADLIAIGTHARRGISRVPIGSVAEWVLANAECDVLVARPARFTFNPLR